MLSLSTQCQPAICLTDELRQGAVMNKADKTMKLLVRNLARSTTEQELASFFEVFGRVQSCDLVLDQATGKSKGFAFVEMPKVGEAKVAIKKLNNREIAGNKIRVKKAESKVEQETNHKPEDEPANSAAVEAVASAENNEPKKFSWEKKKLI